MTVKGKGQSFRQSFQVWTSGMKTSACQGAQGKKSQLGIAGAPLEEDWHEALCPGSWWPLSSHLRAFPKLPRQRGPCEVNGLGSQWVAVAERLVLSDCSDFLLQRFTIQEGFPLERLQLGSVVCTF